MTQPGVRVKGWTKAYRQIVQDTMVGQENLTSRRGERERESYVAAESYVDLGSDGLARVNEPVSKLKKALSFAPRGEH